MAAKDKPCKYSPLPGKEHAFTTMERRDKQGFHVKENICKYCGVKP